MLFWQFFKRVFKWWPPVSGVFFFFWNNPSRYQGCIAFICHQWVAVGWKSQASSQDLEQSSSNNQGLDLALRPEFRDPWSRDFVQWCLMGRSFFCDVEGVFPLAGSSLPEMKGFPACVELSFCSWKVLLPMGHCWTETLEVAALQSLELLWFTVQSF